MDDKVTVEFSVSTKKVGSEYTVTIDLPEYVVYDKNGNVDQEQMYKEAISILQDFFEINWEIK